jgi:NitT/TauT family transport system substrate-binding protein
MNVRSLRLRLLLVFMVLFTSNSVWAENKKIVLSQLFQSVMFLPVYVALDKGLFEKQGLDVSKQTAGSPNAALSAVISGSADFSLHGPEWTAIAASKGANVQIVAGVVNRAAVWIVGKPDFHYKDPADFKGKTVATGLMPIASTSLLNKLLQENKASDGVKVLQVQAGSELAPLLAGQADAAVVYEPGVDQLVARGMKVIHSFPQQYGPYLLSAITTRKDQDPETVLGFITGLNNAMKFMHEHPDVALEVARKEFPTLEPDVVAAAVKRMLDEQVYPESIAISPKSFEVAMQTQIALGNLKEQPVFDQLIGNTFIQNALSTAATTH